MQGVQNIGSVSVVKATQALLGDYLAQCQREIDQCLNSQRTLLIFDLAQCPLLSSQGLEFIVDTQQECLSRGGRVMIAEPQPLCEEILDITGITNFVAVAQDLRSALSEFAR